MSNEFDVAYYLLEDSSGHYALEDGSGSLLKDPQGYPGLVMGDAPVAYWRLGDASGGAVDLAGGNTGTYVAGPTLGVGGPLVGETATAVSFASASTQQVNVTGRNTYCMAATGQLSVEVWFWPSSASAGGSTNQMLASMSLQWDLDGFFTTPPTYYATVFDNAGGFLANPTASDVVASDTWHHAILTINNATTTAIFYLDGVVFAQTTAWGGTGVQPAVSTGAVVIGGPSGTWDGRLAEVAIYPSALSAGQVARHYRCGIQMFTSGIGTTKPAQYPQLLAQ